MSFLYLLCYILYVSISIQIKERTLIRLKKIMTKKKMNNYNEVIEFLIQNELNIQKNLLGFMKQKTSSFTRDIEAKDHEI